MLERLGITHILTVAGGFEPKFPESFVYECVDVKDVPEERLCVHFDRCLKFIAKCLLDGGRVLVHCFAGKSRSATVCAAYVMATEGLSLEETLVAIGRKRPAASPNHGFMAQLASFERELARAAADRELLERRHREDMEQHRRRHALELEACGRRHVSLFCINCHFFLRQKMKK